MVRQFIIFLVRKIISEIMSLQSLELTLIYKINQVILNQDDDYEYKINFINNLININHESYKRRLINIIDEINYNSIIENDEFKNNVKKGLLNYKKYSNNSSKVNDDIPISLIKENSIITFKFENSNLEEEEINKSCMNNKTEKLITYTNNQNQNPSFSLDKKKKNLNKKETFIDNKIYTQRINSKEFLFKYKKKESNYIIKKKKNYSSSVKKKSKIIDGNTLSRNQISGLLFPSSTYSNINSKVEKLNSYSNIFIVKSKTDKDNKIKKKKRQKINDNSKDFNNLRLNYLKNYQNLKNIIDNNKNVKEVKKEKN